MSAGYHTYELMKFPVHFTSALASSVLNRDSHSQGVFVSVLLDEFGPQASRDVEKHWPGVPCSTGACSSWRTLTDFTDTDGDIYGYRGKRMRRGEGQNRRMI